MPSEDANALIAYLKALIHDESRSIPQGFADNRDFMELQEELQKIRESSLALKKANLSVEKCDVAVLKQMENQLRVDEEKHRLLIENASDIISTIDLQGNFTYISPSMEKMTGYTVDEVMHHYLEINYFLPDTLKVMEKALEIVNRMVKNGERFDSVRYEQKQYRKDGSIFWTDTVLSGIYDENGQFKELLGVSRDITEQVKLRDEIIKISQTDKLTQLYNRSKLDDILENEFRRSNRTALPFAVILLDVDHFKWVNDHFGHQVGDAILITLAEIFRSTIRVNDSVGRWGGEEFLFILPDTDEACAMRLAEKIRMRICEFHFEKPKQVTASLGVTVYRGDCSLETIVTRADVAMYAAKKAGRNQVRRI
ncbi:sensor domain-containing diguanylate cyclase [Acetobacterium bakii]|uniref:sensor domain-containing diguanylate cyclase n=1 Tax=Acetobacterium bakii TaxID=52689 RepID=UPI000681A203|nr:sensor domain-containing diguanylate cyclase [Acetobacterium bakii]